MGKVSVVEFYKNKSILVTGGTGFMGKILIEKLLYSCSDLKQIFLLIRPKKGKTAKQRVEELVNLPIFDRIKKEKPNVIQKIVPVFGDASSIRLGLNEEQLAMVIRETNVVFHMAANLKMKDDFKEAIVMNVSGTSYIIEMAKQMPGLVSFVHLSTAFCNIDQEILEEKVYDFPHKPKDLIRCAEWMDEKLLFNMIGPLIGPPENIYVYTKRLAEILVRDEFPNLPVCIARPSIVVPSFKEPVTGWVDNINGPMGYFVGAAKGVIRTVLNDPKNKVEFVPVDFAINGTISIGAVNGSFYEKPKEIPVYNMTNSQCLDITWGEVLKLGRKINDEYPMELGIWIPNGDMTTSPIIYKIESFLYHYLPALIIDFLLFLFMQKRFMMRVYRRVQEGMGVLAFFTTRDWIFKNDRYLEIRDKILDSEREIFDYDHNKIVDIPKYITNASLGTRQYFLKEPLSTLPKTRRTMKIMWCIDRAIKGFLLYFLVKWTLELFGYKLF